MINNQLTICLILIVIGIQFFTMFKINKYKKIIDEKNIKLVQFYLDTKFMYKGLINSLSIPESAKFCAELIGQIKDYYNLEELFIIDSLSMMIPNNNKLKNEIAKAVKTDIDKSFYQSKLHSLKTSLINVGNKEYILHISKLTPGEDSDGVIICVE